MMKKEKERDKKEGNMRVCTLASSSKGNCTVIWNDKEAILIDCGISRTRIEEELRVLGIDPNSIIALLITHEHADHVCGAKLLLKKYSNIKTYIYQPACPVIMEKLSVDSDRVLLFGEGVFQVGQFMVESFPLYHDAAACVGYSIYEGEQKMSILTDSGIITKELLGHLYGSKLVILESNYEESMLWSNPEYPIHLKQRIDGKFGHLSNVWASRAVVDLVCHGVKQVVLAHLSEKNNTPELAKEKSVQECAKNGLQEGVHYLLDVAPAHTLSNIYHLKSKK